MVTSSTSRAELSLKLQVKDTNNAADTLVRAVFVLGLIKYPLQAEIYYF